MKWSNARWLFAFFITSTLAAAYAATPLYPDPAKARDDISAAEVKAGPQHKRVLIVFGANWCGDCKALQAYMERPENYQLVNENYEVVHVNVSSDDSIDKNFDVADQYGVPLKSGIPALAVINADGTMIYAQRHGEFESMRKMDSSSVNEFLIRFKPSKKPLATSQQ